MQYSMNGVHSIRYLEKKDAPELARLEKTYFSSSWTEEQFVKLLRLSHQALSDGGQLPLWCAFGIFIPVEKLVGYISLALDVPGLLLEVHNIAIQQDLRQQGLAGVLLRHALNWGRIKGFKRCLLEVREGNMPALKLYAKEGFKALGRRKNYYADTGEDAIVMASEL